VKKANPFGILQRQSEKTQHTGMARKIILKWALKKKYGIIWTVNIRFRIGKSGGFFECGNERSSSIKKQ
jgi:hypothetical protein